MSYDDNERELLEEQIGDLHKEIKRQTDLISMLQQYIAKPEDMISLMEHSTWVVS